MCIYFAPLSFVKMHTFNNPLIYPIHGLAITIFYTSSNRKFTITAANQRKRVNGCGSVSFFPVCVLFSYTEENVHAYMYQSCNNLGQIHDISYEGLSTFHSIKNPIE